MELPSESHGYLKIFDIYRILIICYLCIASIFNLWHFSGKNFDSEVRDKDFVFLFKMLIVVGHSSA